MIFHESPDDIRHRYLVIFKHFWHTSLIDSRQNPHRALNRRHIRHVGVLTQYGGGHDSVPTSHVVSVTVPSEIICACPVLQLELDIESQSANSC